MRKLTQKFPGLALVAAMLVAALFTLFSAAPVAAQSTTCDTAQVLEVAAEANAAGYYGVTLDLATCQVEIIFVNPSTAGPVVSPLAAPAAPAAATTTAASVRPVTVLEVTDLPEFGDIVAMDYARDSIPGRPQEMAPTVPGQTDWCASFISDAQKTLGYQIGDAVYDCQVIASLIGAHTPSSVSEMAEGIRYLVWVSNVKEHTLPSSYEVVYFDGVSLVYLTTLAVDDMDGVTYSWAVAVE